MLLIFITMRTDDIVFFNIEHITLRHMNLNAFHPTPSDFIRQKLYGMTHSTVFHPTSGIRHFVGSCVTGIIPYLHLHPGHGRARFCLHWASFTLAKLVNIAETVSARISARVKCKHTTSPSELSYSYVLHVI